MNTDEYVVKFWITNSQGYKEQRTESVMLNGKDKHRKAERIVVDKYRKSPHNQRIEIVNVTYQ